MNHKYTEEQKAKAKQLYEEGHKTIDIGEITGVKVPTLKSWIREWTGVKQKKAKLEDAVSESANIMHEINTNGLRIIRDNLKRMKHLESPKELQQVADILKELNKFNENKKEEDQDSEIEFDDPFGD